MYLSTKDLQAHGTRSARQTALNTFNGFLAEGGMSLESFEKLVREENGSRTLIRFIDAFGMYLISKKLSTNTILSYYGNTKTYLVEKFPEMESICSNEMNKIRKRVEKFCNKRQDKTPVKQAPPLREEDLSEVVRTLYKCAAHEVDYHDAALLLTMWCFFGRSSDTLLMKKQQLKLVGGGALLLEFSRLKTGTSQGLTFYKHKNNMLLCPLHSLAVSIIMEESPSSFLVNAHLLTNFEETFSSFEIDVAALLNGNQDNVVEELDNQEEILKKDSSKIGLSAYVNRLLKRVHELSGNLPMNLSSHSFRRGAAQHANANPMLSLQWIVDRGGWQMSSINKAFAYIINSNKEDQKVAKYLSGWGLDEDASIPSLTLLSPILRNRCIPLKKALLSTASGYNGTYVSCNLDDDVQDAIISTALLHFEEMKIIHESSPYISKVYKVCEMVGLTRAECYMCGYTCPIFFKYICSNQ